MTTSIATPTRRLGLRKLTAVLAVLAAILGFGLMNAGSASAASKAVTGCQMPGGGPTINATFYYTGWDGVTADVSRIELASSANLGWNPPVSGTTNPANWKAYKGGGQTPDGGTWTVDGPRAWHIQTSTAWQNVYELDVRALWNGNSDLISIIFNSSVPQSPYITC